MHDSVYISFMVVVTYFNLTEGRSTISGYVVLTRFIFDFTITTKKGFSNYFNAVSKSVMKRKEGNVLFNDALNTFYLRLYGKWPFR